MKKKKAAPLPKLKEKLDKVFSLYIRLRNADEFGMVICYTSGKQIHYKDAHAGHFLSRRHLGTRWNEINVQVQCVGENIFNSGNAPEFGRRIINDYGLEEYEKLFVLSKKEAKYDRFFYENLIEHYTNELAKLQKI